MKCSECVFFIPEPGEKIGPCHGNPPQVMLLPVAPSKADAIASGGRAQGIALQTVRPTVEADDVGCAWGKVKA